MGSYKEALLVLDNVSLQKATEAFDVGCKTLITTQVKDIVVGNNTIYMQVYKLLIISLKLIVSIKFIP